MDGKSVIGQTNHQSVEILRNTGNLVAIKFERYLRGPKYDRLQQAIRANELLVPSSPSSSFPSLPKASLSKAVSSNFIGKLSTSIQVLSVIFITGSTISH